MIEKRKIIEAQRRLVRGRDLIQDTAQELDIGVLPPELAAEIDEVQAAGSIATQKIVTLITRFKVLTDRAEVLGLVKGRDKSEDV
jgi:hypothetical protein